MELTHNDQNQNLSAENGKNGNISKKWNDLAEVSSNTLAQKQNLTLATKILKDFAPNLCAKFATEALERCFSAKTYTLTQLRLNCAGLQNSWLSAQITYLNSISGATQMTEMQMTMLASNISQTYGYLKITELMVFFFQLAGGKYGKFYGAIDPMQIMVNLNEFIKYRSIMLDKIESDRRSEERNKMLNNPKCITREQYEAQKKQNAK
jgi:hypothetical protein